QRAGHSPANSCCPDVGIETDLPTLRRHVLRIVREVRRQTKRCVSTHKLLKRPLVSRHHLVQDVYRPLVAHEHIELVQGARMRPDGHAISVIDALTQSRVVAVPEEVTNSATNPYSGEHILRVLI